MAVREERVEVAPYSFWVTRRGRGSPVLLIHGLSGSSQWWRRNFDDLAREHEVVAIDLVGFGRSRRRPSILPLPLDEAAALLASWIARSFDTPVHLVGHSMGGQIAIELAAARPDLVRSLVLVNSTGMPVAIDAASRLRGLRRPPKGLLSFSRVIGWDFLRAGPTSVGIALSSLLRSDALEAMKRIAAPTLLISGSRDPLIPARQAEAMHEQIEGSSLLVIPGAHVAMWEEPKAFNEAVLSFLRDVEKRESVLEHPVFEPGFSWTFRDCVDGICFRQSGSRRDVVLLHGLGMSSRYFLAVARELHARSLHAVAPDMPGFGFSEGPQLVPLEEQADALIRWADALAIREATWVGHSTGCQLVSRVAQRRPELIARSVYVSPIWNRYPTPVTYLMTALFRDTVRETLQLLEDALIDYLRCGPYRWLRNMFVFVRDASTVPQLNESDVVIAGDDDPLLDFELLREIAGERLVVIKGAHGVTASNASALAETISRRNQRSR